MHVQYWHVWYICMFHVYAHMHVVLVSSGGHMDNGETKTYDSTTAAVYESQVSVAEAELQGFWVAAGSKSKKTIRAERRFLGSSCPNSKSRWGGAAVNRCNWAWYKCSSSSMHWDIRQARACSSDRPRRNHRSIKRVRESSIAGRSNSNGRCQEWACSFRNRRGVKRTTTCAIRQK